MAKVLTVSELAERLRIGRSSAYQLVRAGHIRSIRVGSSIRIPAESVEQFLAGKGKDPDTRPRLGEESSDGR